MDPLPGDEGKPKRMQPKQQHYILASAAAQAVLGQKHNERIAKPPHGRCRAIR